MDDRKDIDLFAISDRVFACRDEYPNLPAPQQVFLCIWELEADVSNGGFDQYYFNSTGDHASDTPRALDAIGASKAAAIVRKANALFGEAGPSPDRNVRQGQLDAIRERVEEAMTDLDHEFFSYPDDLDGLLKAYVRSHLASF